MTNPHSVDYNTCYKRRVSGRAAVFFLRFCRLFSSESSVRPWNADQTQSCKIQIVRKLTPCLLNKCFLLFVCLLFHRSIFSLARVLPVISLFGTTSATRDAPPPKETAGWKLQRLIRTGPVLHDGKPETAFTFSGSYRARLNEIRTIYK